MRGIEDGNERYNTGYSSIGKYLARLPAFRMYAFGRYLRLQLFPVGGGPDAQNKEQQKRKQAGPAGTEKGGGADDTRQQGTGNR